MVDSARSLTKNMLLVWSGISLILIYAPVISLVIYGFNAGQYALRWEGFSFRWYAAALTNPEMLLALFNSLFIGFISTILAVMLAFFYCLWAHRTKFRRLAGTSDSLMSLPLFIPEIVLSIGLLVMIVRFLKPAVLELGFSIDSVVAVIIGHTTIAVGYASLVLRARFNTYDIQQELAAKDLGADKWQIFTTVMLPQIMPGLAAAACLSFAVSLDDFYVSYFLSTGGSALKTLPLYIWSLQGRKAMTPEINVVSSVLLILALLFFCTGLALSRSRTTGNDTRKGKS
jgi:spermidine/putrescine transport system permease protein